jgi:hypothetical protein
MKTDKIYPYYLSYLEERLRDGKISKGSFALLKMSDSPFCDFKFRFENDEPFTKKMLELHKSEVRDQKIDDIFDDLD